VRTRDDFAAWIERVAGGEADVLTRDPIIAFEATSGTTRGAQLVPYTGESLEAFADAVLPWLHDLAKRRPAVTKGRIYAAISPATRPPMKTPGGIAVGLPSDAAYLGEALVDPFMRLLAVSPMLGAMSDVAAWQSGTIAQLLAARDLSFISVWSPTFLVALLDALPAGVDPADVWPQLDCVSCWADGASASYARQLAARLPQAVIEPKGLLATEAPVSVSWGAGDPVTALLSTVVEYVDDANLPHLADDLAVGARYRVVVTTPGGLYRYALGDVVRCTSTAHGIARLRFEGRAGLVSDLVGEKLEDSFVASVLGKLDVAAVLVPDGAARRYKLWADTTNVDGLAAHVDAALGANPHYAHARTLGQLGPVIAYARPQFMLRLSARQMAAGARLGDVKACGLLLGENDE